MIKKQQTFYGDYCEGKAIDFLYHLEKCFEIVDVNMKVYLVKKEYTSEKRCKVVVKYK